MKPLMSKLPMMLGMMSLWQACGRASDSASQLDWVASRAGESRYAYLEPRDLSEQFVFGAQIIKVEAFASSALEMSVPPLNVSLNLKSKSGNDYVLEVVSPKASEPLFAFDVKKSGSRYEVDFATAGNDVRLTELIDVIGGQTTSRKANAVWISSGTPSVLGVSQDNNTVVVDLLHKVAEGQAQRLNAERLAVRPVPGGKSGDVQVRLFLQRKSAIPAPLTERTVGEGRESAVGYFAPGLGDQKPELPIQRFAVGSDFKTNDKIKFYLKDVPSDMLQTARKAVLSWNIAFGREVVQVETAPAGVDAGDPRYNVIKWYEGLDQDVNWAGVARMAVEPDTGVVIGGHLYINGSSVRNLYRGVTKFSQDLYAESPKVFSGRIGNVDFERSPGETPVIPYVTSADQDFESYMQGYYSETIAHEVGHVLGLRHNFRGTTLVTSGTSASVMDYAPRSERSTFHGPGKYDVAAIRWGYFAEQPAPGLPFCTDEDLWTYYDCSQGDFGDAVDYAVKGLLDGTKILTSAAVKVTDEAFVSSLVSTMENAIKIKRLSSQLPAATRTETLEQIDAAYSYLWNAKPDASLSGADLQIVQDNLDLVRTLADKKLKSLRSQGRY